MTVLIDKIFKDHTTKNDWYKGKRMQIADFLGHNKFSRNALRDLPFWWIFKLNKNKNREIEDLTSLENNVPTWQCQTEYIMYQ